jgi:hypothetical protein
MASVAKQAALPEVSRMIFMSDKRAFHGKRSKASGFTRSIANDLYER